MKVKKYILLYFSFFIYSLSGVFAKLASGQDFLSLKYILLLGGVFFILFIYALLWQQSLKRFTLSAAFVNKPIIIVFGFLWAILLFGETLTLKNIIGSVLIIIGVIGAMQDE